MSLSFPSNIIENSDESITDGNNDDDNPEKNDKNDDEENQNVNNINKQENEERIKVFRPLVSPFNCSFPKSSFSFLQTREYCNAQSPTIVENEMKTNSMFINNICLSKKLLKHKGCVNTVRWNETGSLLISGSDDCNLCIWSGENYKLLSCIETGHTNNIFGAQFVPNSSDHKIVSSAADGEIRVIDLESDIPSFPLFLPYNSKQISLLSSHYDIVMKFEFLPTIPHAILSTHQDGTVRLIDTRTKSHEDQLIVKVKEPPCYGIAFNPHSPSIFALTSGDYFTRIYDIRKPSRPYRSSPSTQCLQKFFAPEVENSLAIKKKVSATDVQWSSENELLVNHSSFDVVLFNASENQWNEEFSTSVLQTYRGRANRDTFLKEAKFVGGGRYVATGSDSGLLFIWDKLSGDLVRKLPSDQFIVNGVAPHPSFPTIVTCGIEHDVKIFEYAETEKDERFEKEFTEIPIGKETRSLSRRLHFPSRDELDIVTISEADSRCAAAENYRKEGNKFAISKDWSQARERYTLALKALHYRPPTSHTLAQREFSRIFCMLNLAACHVAQKDFASAKSLCLKVLEVEPNNEKALFRLSKSLLELNELESCFHFVNKARELYPENKEFVAIFNAATSKQKQQQQKESEIFKNLFS